MALFKAAIRLAPANAGFYRNLVLAYQRQGKTAEAEALMSQFRWLSGDMKTP